MRFAIRWITALTLLCFPLSLSAQIPAWTAVASDGSVDEANYTPAVNFAFTGASLGFLGASINPSIVAHYNVTNIPGVPNPAWTTLELGAIDTSAVLNNQVSATLIRVTRCTGAQLAICTATSVTTTVGVCTPCTFPPNTFDFNQFLYYVEVRISRTASTVTEQATTLRIF
ncbi:MAG: hypothetical protein ABJC13_11935 [Acidobacteriota bacterium]